MTIGINAANSIKVLIIRISFAVTALTTVVFIFACSRSEHKPAGRPEKLTIAVVQTFYPALTLIAKSNNYFRDEGLDVTVQLHQTGVSALDALNAGKADLASTAETPVTFLLHFLPVFGGIGFVTI